MGLAGREVATQREASTASEVVVPSGSPSGSLVQLLGVIVSRGIGSGSAGTLQFKDRDSDDVLFELALPLWSNTSVQVPREILIPGNGIRFPSGIKFQPGAAAFFTSITVIYRA